MKKIVECVPNFSEGRDPATIDAIAAAIRQTSGCRLLDVDPGRSTHRTVYTFVGDPESVVEGALAAARVARERIDMRRHQGGHPRLGALDVCPFIPVSGVTMETCIQVAKNFAGRMAEALDVPIYLYEAAAAHDYRRSLAQIRAGEYEGLAEKLKDPRWRPDVGPARWVPAWGATVTGARHFLIAYNVNILGTPNQAHRIALNLREAGRGAGQPGRLKAVKALGWFVKEYNLAQVSANLSDFRVTPMHTLYEAVCQEAASLQVGVAGSEIVGLVPLAAILMAADYYIDREHLLIIDEDQKVRLVIERLGLNAVAPFTPWEKIIEYRVAQAPDEPLAGMRLRGFIEALGARSTTPGGGSASAVMAAMGAALGAMVAKLTYGVRRFESVDRQMRAIIPPLHQVTQALIPMIDADAGAYNTYLEGLRMPRQSAAEKALRREKIQAGLKQATQVPLSTMQLADRAWEPLREAARYGNPASKSDLQVAARALESGIWGAFQNVAINVADIEDTVFKAETLKTAETLAVRARAQCAALLEILKSR